MARGAHTRQSGKSTEHSSMFHMYPLSRPFITSRECVPNPMGCRRSADDWVWLGGFQQKIFKISHLIYNTTNSTFKQPHGILQCSCFGQSHISSLQWRHNGLAGISNHQPHDCLPNRLFTRRSKKTSKLSVTGLCVGIHRWPVSSLHKGPVTQKCFHLMTSSCVMKPMNDMINGSNQQIVIQLFNTLRPRQNGRHFADDIFKCIFLNENVWIPIKISMKFVPKGPINNIPALVQIMAWRRPGDKPLSEPMMISLQTHIYASLGLNELRWSATHVNKNWLNTRFKM